METSETPEAISLACLFGFPRFFFLQACLYGFGGPNSVHPPHMLRKEHSRSDFRCLPLSACQPSRNAVRLPRAVSQHLTISPQTSLHHVSRRTLTRPANRARQLPTWLSERVPQRKLNETRVPLFFRPGNAAKSSSSEALAAGRVFLLLRWLDVYVSSLYNGSISISRLFAGSVFKDLPR